MFKVGDRVWWKTHKVYGEVVDVKYDKHNKPLVWLVDTKGFKGLRFDLFHIEDHLHQTAQTMFEELGFKNQGGDEWHHEELNKNIYFDYDKTVSCYSYHTTVPTNRPESMTMQELKASYQMCIEKGWVE